MKEFDVKDIIRFLNFISKNGIYVCSSQDLFNDIKFPFERKNFVSIISIISNRLLKPLSREIEYSLTCPRKPFRASLSPSLEGTQVTLVENTRDRFILSCTRNRQRIQPRRGGGIKSFVKTYCPRYWTFYNEHHRRYTGDRI